MFDESVMDPLKVARAAPESGAAVPGLRQHDRAAALPSPRRACRTGDGMSHDCASCALNPQRLEVVAGGYDFVVAVAGNPNTGKSTVFNAMTGLRQRSGNWPGTTV